MILRNFIYACIIISCFLCGCRKSSDADDQRLTWTTDAPLSIPYRVRLQRLEKGNLVRNHSFETGRTFTLDTSKTSFVIDGWQQIGQHVYCVDTQIDSLYADNEAFSGIRSVKIIRKNAFEADEQGEGVMSDFIKVIPGNYTFSFYARLENVLPARARLGTRMFDAIDVYLQFYDRNKIILSPKYPYPHINQIINTSFKSLSFANYNEIPSFGWGKVIGKSAHFPFPEGDIPSEAQYVKIFIGLKGSGTMWIDSVNFAYSDRNFSVAERMRKYTDTTFTGYEAIVPTPKKYQKMESVFLSTSGAKNEQNLLILIPDNPDLLLIKAAELIRNAVNMSLESGESNQVAVPKIQVVKNVTHLQTEKSRLIFSLGSTDLFRNFQARLPLADIRPYPQGYFIHSTSDLPNIVFLGGNNSTGIYYAALSVLQMIDKKSPVFHNARIIDYPDFANRYCAIDVRQEEGRQSIELYGELISCKINGAFYEMVSTSQKQPANSGQKFISDNAAFHGPLFAVYQLPDYKQPVDSTLTYTFPVHLPSCIFCHVLDRNDLAAYRVAGYPGFVSLLLPPAFNNQLLDYSYAPAAVNPVLKDTKSLYSGCSYFSYYTDDADIERFIQYAGEKPVFMDNSMQIFTPFGHYAGNDPFYPGKIRLYNIFEPFGNNKIREHFAKLDTSLFFMNTSANSEIDIIRLFTAADFMWNSKSYVGDLSLWKVLQSRYGAEVSRELITYADKYGHMLEILTRMQGSKQLPRYVKDGQQILTELNHMVSSIGRSLGIHHRLVLELQALNSELLIKLRLYTQYIH